MIANLRFALLALALSFGAAAAEDAGSPATDSKDAPAHAATPAPATPALAAPLNPTPGPEAAPSPGTPGSSANPSAAIVAPVSLAGEKIEAIRTPSNPDAWGGLQKFGAEVLSQRVASYDLKAVLDPKAHTVEGSEVLRWTNRSQVPVSTVYFHLYLNGFESTHSTWMTEKGTGNFRSGVETKKGEWGWIDVLEISQSGALATLSFVHPDGGPETDRSVLRADLAEAVAPGATVELAIKFHDQLPRVIARTGWWDSFHLVAQWFPKIGVLELPGERGATAPRWNVHEFHLNSEFYADFGNYDLEITAPKEFTVAATGERIGVPRETQAGVVHHFHQDDIHDAVFTAWDKYAAPLKGTYTGAGSPTVTVETYFPSEFAASGAVSHQATLDSLAYFSNTLGPYPYRHVTVIVPPYNAQEAGGMEYETFFTSEGGNNLLSGYTRFVAVHEFGHGYFMGLLATNEFEEPYLDEGMNELWDMRMLDGELLETHIPLIGQFGFELPGLDYWDTERLSRGPGAFNPDPVAASSWKRWSNGSYASIYPKTALLFHDLEYLLGGDSFARGMKLYYERWHHRHPSTADLREALVDACDKPEEKALVERWFEEQIYGTALVDDSIASVESEELVPEPGTVLENGKRTEFDEEEMKKQVAATRKAFDAARADAGPEQKKEAKAAKDASDAGAAAKDFKPGPYLFRSVVRAQRRGVQVPQQLLVKFEDGGSQTILWPPGEAWHRWVFDGPARIESAQLDPEHKLILDLNKLDDGRTRKSESSAAHRWALEVATWFELAFALVGGL